MSSFKFRLEQVLNYRAQLEEQATLAMAKARQAHDAKAREVMDLETRLLEHEKEWSGKKEINIDELWLARNYSEGLREDIARERANLASLFRELEVRRMELVEKAQERNLLEKLKLRQAERHEQEERQKELKTYDETATLRHQPVSV